MGVAIASYSVSMTLGAALAVALALPLTHWFGGRWAWSLAVWAVPAALAFGVWWWLFPGQSLAARREARSEPLPLRSYRAWLLTLFFAAQSGIFYALTTWLVARYEQAGLSEASASGYGTLFMATGIAGAFLMPLLAARVSDRRWLLAGVTGSTCVTILLIAWLPTQLPWLVSALLGMASAGIFAVSLALPVLETESPQEAASLTSMMLTFGYLIGSVLPALLGVIRDVAGDYSLAFSVLAALALAMVIISVLMPTEQPRPSITKAEKLEAQEPS
jgi:CP family cyanate transporter-like MFS transporter